MAETGYKLTEADGTTYGGTRWGEGVTHKATGKGKELCTDGWIHYYSSPELAALMNPAHANFRNPICWEFQPASRRKREADKLGAKEGTTTHKVPLPTFTTEQRVAFSIFCALEVYKARAFHRWAEDWLSGTDRSAASAAEAAEAAAVAPSSLVAAAVAASAAEAAEVAAVAARAAAVAASAAEAAAVAARAAAVAPSSLVAARAAAEAAAAVAARAADIDFAVLAKKAHDWQDPVGEEEAT